MATKKAMRKQDNPMPKGESLPAAGAPATAVQARPEPKQQPQSATGQRDGLVLVSMLIVATAISAMLFLHFAVPPSIAVGAGALAWMLFLLIHKQVQKSAQIDQLKAELSRAKGPARPKGAAPPQPSSRSAPPRDDAFGRSVIGSSAPQSAEATQEPAATPFPGIAAELQAAREARNELPRWEPKDLSRKPALDPALLPNTGVLKDTGPRDLGGAPSLPLDASSFPAAPASGPAAEFRAPQWPVFDAAKPAAAPSGAPPAASATGPAQRPVPNEAVRDQWSFRPRGEGGLPPALPGLTSGPAAPASAKTIESDLEMVQRKIKALAAEVNANEVARSPKLPGAPFSDAPSPVEGKLPTLSDVRPAKLQADAIEESIDALKAAAGSMRRGAADVGAHAGRVEPKLGNTLASGPVDKPSERPAAPARSGLPELGELVIPSTAEPIAVSADSRRVDQPSLAINPSSLPPIEDDPLLDYAAPPPPLTARMSRAAALMQAIEQKEFDVLLRPIVDLAANEVGHYEVSVRLRAQDNGLDQSATDSAASDALAELGTAALARFDILRFSQAATLSARLDARGKRGAVFVGLSNATLNDRGFLETFATAFEERRRISEQVILTFSQADVDRFDSESWQALNDMQSVGFLFAIDQIRHLNSDFAALGRAGFAFVRLNARSLIDGQSLGDRYVTGEELRQRAALAGVTIIADGIADADTQSRLVGCGVPLGEGTVFGAPRPFGVNSAPASGRSAAA